jgi:hypothetical protein
MRSTVSGWWSWLVVFWITAVFALSVVSVFEEDGTIAGSLLMAGLGAATATGFALRHSRPALGAALLVFSVGFVGAGFFWAFLIPTALALVIIAGGFVKGEIAFRERVAPML